MRAIHHGVWVLVVVALVLGSVDAEAATVYVRDAPPSSSAPMGGQELVYVAGAGETNRLTINARPPTSLVSSWTVTDPGAVIVAGPSCVSIDPHASRCAVPFSPGPPAGELIAADVSLGDLDDSLTFTQPPGDPFLHPVLLANGGAGNDRLFGASGGGELHGGPGDDQLVAGMAGTAPTGPIGGVTLLDGGGGRDQLIGGNGDDTLSDGDIDGAPGSAGPGPDVLDGGGGTDTVSYSARRVPVSVRLGVHAASGERGEGDVVRNVESVIGGRADDQLIGNSAPNVLDGGGGHNAMSGRGGDDTFVNAHAPIACGPGDDRVVSPHSTDILNSCERVVLFGYGADNGDYADWPALPRDVGPRAVAYDVHCVPYFDPDADVQTMPPCSGRISLREASGRHRRLGAGRFPRGAWVARAVRVKLTPLGRRLATRRHGVRTTIRLAIDGYGAERWTIQLKVPR